MREVFSSWGLVWIASSQTIPGRRFCCYEFAISLIDLMRRCLTSDNA